MEDLENRTYGKARAWDEHGNEVEPDPEWSAAASRTLVRAMQHTIPKTAAVGLTELGCALPNKYLPGLGLEQQEEPLKPLSNYEYFIQCVEGWEWQDDHINYKHKSS